MIQLILGDCLEKMREIPDNSVDSIITDPPYGLGFMGKNWDKGVPGVEFWREMIRVLKPGGHLLAFGGTRTYHRMAVAIEDAGFEVRDMIEWVYGSGFPKSLNIGKAVDKLQGNEREVTTSNVDCEWLNKGETCKGHGDNNGRYGETIHAQPSKGTSEWEGWGTALKPAHEPICMARKPLAEKTVAENCLKYGTGGINIDDSRVGKEGARFNGRKVDSDIYGKYGTDKPKEVYDYGRFPANLVHDNSEEVKACFPNESEKFFKSIIYQAKASKSERGKENNHPTVKPIALMEYLIKMVTPKGGTVLDPFMGSGTTGVAAVNTGRNFIGIELEEEYYKIATKRIEEAERVNSSEIPNS